MWWWGSRLFHMRFMPRNFIHDRCYYSAPVGAHPLRGGLGLIRMSRHLKMTFALKKLIKCRDMSRHLPENFDI